MKFLLELKAINRREHFFGRNRLPNLSFYLAEDQLLLLGILNSKGDGKRVLILFFRSSQGDVGAINLNLPQIVIS